MLNDPMYIATELNPGQIATTSNYSGMNVFRLTDVAPGRSVREGVLGGFPASLTISHSQTKENAPFATTRSVIRLDRKVYSESIGKTATLSAYLVVAQPVMAEATPETAAALARALAAQCLFGIQTSSVSTEAVDGTVISDFLVRVLSGEP